MLPSIWNLDPLINITPLEDMHFDICRGVAKSTRDLSTRVVPNFEMQGNIRAAIDFKNSDSARIAAVANDHTHLLSPDELGVYDSLTYNQKRVFLELYKGGYNDGEFVRVRFTKKENLHDKYSTFYSNTTDWTENTKHFPKLIEWINTLPFADIGRILIIITKHYLHGDLHYDRRDDWLDGRHHFLWINPFGQKKFSIYDGYEEIPIPHKAMFFDTGYMHGAGINDKTVYTIRIDGQFTREFCDRANIPWKQR